MGTDYGTREWDGQRRVKEENWDNCNRITIKKILNQLPTKKKKIFSIFSLRKT